MRNLARSWIVDRRARNIRTNVVSRAVVPTTGYDRRGLSAQMIEEFVSQQAVAIPLGRVGTVEEIANAVAFSASDESSFINGVELFVGGGMTQI